MNFLLQQSRRAENKTTKTITEKNELPISTLTCKNLAERDPMPPTLIATINLQLCFSGTNSWSLTIFQILR